MRVLTISDNPRVRIVHSFVTEEEAQALIAVASRHYHRSSTARAGDDQHRTSESAMLPRNNEAVLALRHRMAFFVGYPEAALEPLQAVRYQVRPSTQPCAAQPFPAQP